MDRIDPTVLHQTEQSSGSRPRILAVDDQRDCLRILEMLLRAADMECFSCQDGQSALALLSHQSIDVIILDVMMPGMDGYEVCRRIKADERTRDIPILFLTGMAETEDKVRGFKVGGHDYLSKTLNRQELLARTQAALRVKQLQDHLKHRLRLQQRINQLHQGMLSQHWQKTLGQMAASLAHEINNPLTVALGNVELLAIEGTLTEPDIDRLETINESLQRVGQKLRSLLLIGQVNRCLQIVHLATLANDILALVNYQVVVHGVTVRTELDDRCRWQGVPAELARASLYIFNNAIEAVAGRPDPSITLQVQRNGSQQYIKISDNGAGIPEDIRSRMFEPFFSTKGGHHNGLGLYLANEIVTSAGGSIQFKPAEGGNTEFTIHLPVNVPASSGSAGAPS